MDVLSDWLRVLETRGLLLARSRFAAPWGIAIPASGDCMFHVVSEGVCWLRCPGEEPLLLELGDFVLLPGGESHELVHSRDGLTEDLSVVLARAQSPVGDVAGSVVCGAYQSGALRPLPLIRSLPKIVHFRAEELSQDVGLASVIQLLLAVVERPGPGGEALLPTLFDALLLYTLRAWGNKTCSQNRWMAGLGDPALSAALQQMHSEPGRAWTVETLAQAAGLSRAVFAKRFSEAFGEPPLGYLTAWRMRLAAKMFAEAKVSVVEAATNLGYDSEFAFSRAFKRVLGVAPSVYRRQAQPVR
ncbi:MAG: AraC family transcriptional regulator [Acidobacteria bacterium]|nr:AraC family transcriptional regulator [Acidobacteriota bacterium]